MPPTAGESARPIEAGLVWETAVQSFETSRPSPAKGKAVSERLILSVRNSTDVARHSAPVRSGVPFPQGVLGSSRTMRLLDSPGSEIALQTRTLGHWPDGTVKWALVDFQADIPASSEAAYTLEYGSAVSRGTFETPLCVMEDANGVTVDTGRLRIRWDRSEFGPLSEITRGGEGYIDGSDIVVTGTDGQEHRSSNAEADLLEIEESGPLQLHRACGGESRVRRWRSAAALGVPGTCVRGAGYVQVDHNFVNDNLETSFTDIGSMYMKIRTAGGAAEANEIIQTHDDRSVVNGQVGDKRLQGHVRAGDVEVEMEDFWQQYPKSLRTSAEGIEIGLCPSIGEEDYRSGRRGRVQAVFLPEGRGIPIPGGDIEDAHDIRWRRPRERRAVAGGTGVRRVELRERGLSVRLLPAGMAAPSTTKRESNSYLQNTEGATTRTVNTGC